RLGTDPPFARVRAVRPSTGATNPANESARSTLKIRKAGIGTSLCMLCHDSRCTTREVVFSATPEWLPGGMWTGYPTTACNTAACFMFPRINLFDRLQISCHWIVSKPGRLGRQASDPGLRKSKRHSAKGSIPLRARQDCVEVLVS